MPSLAPPSQRTQSRSDSTRFCLFLTAAFILGGTASSSAPAPAETPAVELPPFIVKGSKSRASMSLWQWGYMSFPGFEVLTYCDRLTSDSFVGNFAAQMSILRKVAPAAFEAPPSVRTSLILMDNEQARSISDDMNRVMTGKSADTNLGQPGLATRRVFFPQLRLNDEESTAINIVLRNRFEFNGLVIEPGYVRYLMESRVPRLPAWYVTAMVDLYRGAVFGANPVTTNTSRQTTISTTTATFSPILWISDEETRAVRTDAAHKRALLPMSALLFTKPLSEGFDEPTRKLVRAWKSQADLLLQWVIADKSLGRVEALRHFLDLCDQGRRNEAAFRECFGLGFAAMQQRLADYLPRAIEDTVTVESDKNILDETLRTASNAEYRRIWGNWEQLEISFVKSQDPLLVYPYVDQAEDTLGGAYHEGERDPGVLAVLGVYEAEMKDTEKARQVLESAAEAKVAYPRVYTALARIRFDAALAHPDAPGGRLGNAQVDSILAPLRQAIALSPPQSATYVLTALVFGNSMVVPAAADFAMLDEGRRNFPEDAELATAVAALKARYAIQPGQASR